MNPQSLQSIALNCVTLDRPEALLTLPRALVIRLVKQEILRIKENNIGKWVSVPTIEMLIFNLQSILWTSQYHCSTVSENQKIKAVILMTALMLESLLKIKL